MPCHPQKNSVYGVTVPAKAMLFGEYGVLFGGFAVAATLGSLSNLQLKVTAQLVEKPLDFAETETALQFYSSFFGETITVKLEDLKPEHMPQGSEKFFVRALMPLFKLFEDIVSQGCIVKINVTESFSPSLGLGSSSALIVSLYQLLVLLHQKALNFENFSEGEEVFRHVPLEEAWPNLYAMLQSAQGTGSGYDIAVQYASSNLYLVTNESNKSPELKNRLFIYRKSDAPQSYCLLEELSCDWFWKHAGFLIPTGQLANTEAILKSLPGDKENIDLQKFAAEHAEIALSAIAILKSESEWINDLKPHPLSHLFQASLDVAKRQGIARHLEQMKLPKRGALYKTMGAGHGDCLWCIGDRSEFDFSDGQDLGNFQFPMQNHVHKDFGTDFGALIELC